VVDVKYEEIERVEPYEVQVLKYVAENREVEMPRTVTRRVPITTTQLVPVDSYLRLPVEISSPPVEMSTPRIILSTPTVVESAAVTDPNRVVAGKPVIERRLLSETSVVVPESDAAKPATTMVEVERPAVPLSDDNRSGDESADKRKVEGDSDKKTEPTPADTQKSEADLPPALDQSK
jgi:hypothetical protein